VTQIALENTGSVLIARIGNPPSGYMNEDTANELVALLDRVEQDDNIRVVVLTGSLDDVFIRHYDVGLLEQRGRQMADKGYTFDVSRSIPESPYLIALRRIDTMPKPFIAAINGTAMGGGFELALACDIRLVQDGPYNLGLPEINIGLLPGAGGTQRLARLIGESKALELIMQGATFSPREAAAMGIASSCVEGDVLPAAIEMAVELASKHPRALAHIKYLIKGSTQRNINEGLADERTLFCDLMVDPDSIELMSAMNSGKIDITTRRHS
jgi:enoyl-CoA hydratase